MKPQQRKFIVEFKSGRRRANKPTSIWSDTDLKALVREAENDAPHLFGGAERAHAIAPEQSIQSAANEIAVTDPVAQVQDALMEPAEQAVEVPSLSLAETEDAQKATVKAPVRRRMKRDSRPADSSSSTASVVVAEPASNGVDELTLLEEENLRLKGQLAVKLQQENIQLRKMLERFAKAA
ncbi:hypothetical protein [Mycoplana sp. MJR14]|uniref:hypothetical protein n=1 Tax=Mycoplana sp. MJR14 TaxID=3032583 RepID=UPI0023DCCDA7|nr:hypothetical protein [Mycoplana sp. MJR14]MDF1631409.1 hypothetical protein [Mycoplana sp. MJR14]